MVPDRSAGQRLSADQVLRVTAGRMEGDVGLKQGSAHRRAGAMKA
jgi:hypothetical protein